MNGHNDGPPGGVCQDLNLCLTSSAEREAVRAALRGVVASRPEDALVYIAFGAGAKPELSGPLLAVAWRLAALLRIEARPTERIGEAA